MVTILDGVAAVFYRMRRSPAARFERQIGRRQWWRPEALERYNEERTRALAVHASRHVPYYRDLFRRLQLDPAGMRFPDDWNRIPILTKDDLRANFDALCAEGQGERARENATGGSTGRPVRFMTDAVQLDMMDGFFRVVQRWAGWKSADIALHLWGGRAAVGGPPGARSMLHARLSGRMILPVYEFDGRTFERWQDVIARVRPAIVYGYPSVMAEFARWLEHRGERLAGLRGVICSAELLLPEHRAVIERAFGCHVFNQYGSRETPAVSCECPAGRMHVFNDLNRVDFLGDGRFAVTPLDNLVQPLLRYDLEDSGSPEPGTCECGRGYPLMSISVGRLRDHLRATDGRTIYAGFVTRLMDAEGWVNRFQFRQTRTDLLELLVQPDDADGADARAADLKERIAPRVREMMGSAVRLDVRVVGAIDRTTAGKHRYVVNEIEEQHA